MAHAFRLDLLDNPPYGGPVPYVSLQDRHPGNPRAAIRPRRQHHRGVTGVSQAPGDGMTDEAEPAGDEYAQGLLHLAREEIQAYTTVDGSAP